MAEEVGKEFVFPDAQTVWYSRRVWIASGIIALATVGFVFAYSFGVLVPAQEASDPGDDTALNVHFTIMFLTGLSFAIAAMWLACQHIPMTWRRACRAVGLKGRAGLVLFLPRYSGRFPGFTLSVVLRRSRPKTLEPGAVVVGEFHHRNYLSFPAVFSAKFANPLPDWLSMFRRGPDAEGKAHAATTGDALIDGKLSIASAEGHGAKRLARNSAFVKALRSQPSLLEYVCIQSSTLYLFTSGYTANRKDLDAVLTYVIRVAGAVAEAFSDAGSPAKRG